MKTLIINKVNYLKSIFSIFKIGESLFINNGKFLVNNDKKLGIDTLNSYRHSNGYISIILKGEIRIYNEELTLLNTIIDEGIDSESSGVEFFDENTYIIFKTTDVTNVLIFTNNKMIGDIGNFWGKFLNPYSRLNFNENTFSNPSYFRCSDLLDTKTYFEFQCNPNEKVVNNFCIWNEKLVFPLVRNNQLYLMMLNLHTGEVIWNMEIAYPNFMMSEKGLLVSLWGDDGLYPDKHRQYQIINLENLSVDIGVPKGAGPFYNVNTPGHLQLLYGNKLYFSDNRHSYAGQKPNPVRVGCFDIESKTVDFLYEINESPLSPISEIINSHGKLYVRNANDELFVFELD